MEVDINNIDGASLLLPSVLAVDLRMAQPADDIAKFMTDNFERRIGRGGRDNIDHPPGTHVDRANAAAGALGLLQRVMACVEQLREAQGRDPDR